MHQTGFNEALRGGSRAFARPRDIVGSDLSHEQKIKLLREWEMDLRELQVAEEENMAEGDASEVNAELLQECRHALAELGAADENGGKAPTKHGGA